MNSERWERLMELYTLASERPAAERAEFLREACGDDEDLLREVEELLEADPPDAFMSPPAKALELFGIGLEDRRLGDFRLLRELGRGGMGVVYLASQIPLQRAAAVKILPSVNRDERARERFRREVHAASKLDHPNIVPVLASGEANGLAWYAMSFVDGHDLARELKVQQQGGETLLPRFGTPEYAAAVVAMCADLAEGIQAAHDGGVVHRDVKPSNVLLDRRGRARLSDFGIARDERFGTLTSTDAVQGTPHYMSPEQARALDVRVDHRTDVYSLSVVLYELLTLRRAFEGRTSQEVLDKIKTKVPQPLRRCNPSVARDLATICEKGMAKRPAHRYATAGELADDLRRFLALRAIRARPPSLVQRLADGVRRHARAAAVAAALVAATLLGFWASERRTVRAAYSADRAAFETVLGGAPWLAVTDELVATRRRLVRLQADGMPSELRPIADRLAALFEADRDERVALCRQLHEDGLGGRPGGPRYRGHKTAADQAKLQLSLAEASEAALLYPEDEELRELADPASCYPHVGVRLADDVAARFGPGAGRVLMSAFDPIAETFGGWRELGATPLEDVAVPQGTFRFRVEIDGYGASELSRSLEPSATRFELVAEVRPRDDVAAGMIPIPAGEIVHRGGALGCLPDGTTSSFDAFRIDPTEVSNGDFVAYLEATGAAPPRIWVELGYVDSWRQLPIGDVGERWLRLPAVGVSFFEARAYAEWAGKRLPTHVELERAQRGVDQVQLPTTGRANVDGPQGNQEGTPVANYRQYLANALPVDDPAYRQGPEGLFHAYGNVSEYTDTPPLVQQHDTMAVNAWRRIALGGAWDAKARQQALDAHALRDIGPDFSNLCTGFRCVVSVP